MTDILIVGAGILGAATAHRLSRQGAQVTIVEADRPGGGTSGASFSWVNAQEKSPPAYFQLNQAGVRAHRELADELGGDWYHPGGDVAIGRGEAAARVTDKIDRHRAMGYGVETLDRAAIQRLEPDLDLGDAGADLVGAHFVDEAWIDAPTLIERLLAVAGEAGAILVRDEVVAVVGDGARAVGVRIADGTVHRADQVVLAAGPATESLVATADARLPMSPSPGLLLRTGPVAATIRHVIHGGDVALRPDGAGRLLVSSRDVDARLDPTIRQIGIDDPAVTEVMGRAARLVPALRSGAVVEDARIGIRSVAVDGMPVAGPVPGLDGLYALVTHSGVTLAPVLGRLVSEELLGRPQAALEPYRLDRFAATM